MSQEPSSLDDVFTTPEPFARVRTSDNPEAIAKHAILVLEKGLLEHFGVEVHSGIELECSYRFPKALQQQLVNDVKPSEPRVKHNFLHGEKRHVFTPAGKRQGSHDPNDSHDLTVNLTGMGIAEPTDRPVYQRDDAMFTQLPVTDCLFPDSSWISHTYCEDVPMENGWSQYEHVISHQGPQEDITFGEGRMLKLARATEALRKTVASTPKERRNFAKQPLHNQWLNHVANAITERSTEAISPTGHPQGMHINFSLTRKGKALLRFKEEREAFERPLGDMVRENEYLMLPSEQAYQRSKTRENQHVYGAHESNTPYLEITSPSSESNPYYAMLVTLAGIYYALGDRGFDKQSGKFEATHQAAALYPNPKGRKEFASFADRAPDRFFDGHYLLPQLLNHLEPELGNQFFDAIERVPPGKEKPRYQAGIASPQDGLSKSP